MEERQQVPKKKVKRKVKRAVQPPQEPDVVPGGFDDDLDMPMMPTEAEKVESRVTRIDDDFDYAVAFKFGFIGIGQGGSRVAQTFYNMGYKRVVVIDGAHQDLLDVHDEILTLDLETSGSAKDTDTGARSVQDRDEDIWSLLERGVGADVDYILCCACLGGGTGSGAVHKVMEVAKQYLAKLGKPVRVGCIVSLPTNGEGQRTAANAVQMFHKLRHAEPAPLIIMDNQRISELFSVGVTKLYDRCNKQTAQLFHLFNQLAAQRSRLITLDRAELADLLDSGIVVFGASSIGSSGDATVVSKAIREQLGATALARVDLKTARAAGAIFTGSEEVLDALPMDVLNGGFDMLNRLLRENSVLHRGVYVGSSPSLRCFTLLAGLSPPSERLRELGLIGRIPSSTLADHFGVGDV